MAALDFAREHAMEISVRGGGHNVAGHALSEGGLTIDLSRMRSVQVDPRRRAARVEPGALIRDLDQETQAHGLATPGGFISSTGVAGLTLGGGFGYLSRKHGLTVDNLHAIEMVSLGGKLVRASPSEHPDLFWALCGGGGNFGVVTAFEFNLHELGPTVMAGPVVHMLDDAPAALRALSTAMAYAPDTVSCLPVLRYAPPAPFIPEQHHGRPVVLFAMIHAGDPADGEAALAPLRAIGSPVADAVARRPYTAFQSMFDASANAGARNYWKGHYLDTLSDGAIDVLCDGTESMTSRESVIGMLSLGGAVSRQPQDAVAYPHRDARWVLNIQARWRDATEDARHIRWTQETFQAVAPFATGGVYVNFVSGDEGSARVRAAYGKATYAKLESVKAEWDPGNRLHLNQNVPPASAE
jgi:FAD/FMN-containing dehydrogenase